jgi:hypothetical protein
MLSCYHVLCRPNADPFTDGEPVWQSVAQRGGSPIGNVFIANADATLDCAAARITQGLSSVGRILGLGPLGPPAAPKVGMSVIKSGYLTGVTEGRVLQVQGDRVEIQRPPGYPTLYEPSDFGDSGALWIDRDTGSPVAMHTGASPAANAIGRDVRAVLNALAMQLVISP